MDVSLSCRVAVLVLNIFSSLSVVRQSSPQAPPFLHILLHYKDQSLFRACHKRRTKKHLARTDSRFDFSSIFEGCFVLPTENRENFTRQQSQSLIFSDSSRPGGYRSFGKVARPEKNCFNIKESSAPWHGGQYISVKGWNRFMQSKAYVELHIGANASVRKRQFYAHPLQWLNFITIILRHKGECRKAETDFDLSGCSFKLLEGDCNI